MQPLITKDPSKGYLTPEAKPFYSSTDKILCFMVEIANWIQEK